MKFGDMKRDVNLVDNTAQGVFGKYTRKAFLKEGKELFEKHPEYHYVSEDPYIRNNNDLYTSVLWAYMIDFILKEHPETQWQYDFGKWQEIHSEEHAGRYKGKENKIYLGINGRFIRWYNDQLREQANPGILDRERQERIREQAQKDKELQESIELHRQIDAYYATKHPRVECPYCHSMNTEKISGVARGVSIYALGVASPKIGKQWHCKQCGSNF